MILQELDEIIKDVFNKDVLVKSVDSVYEKDTKGDFLKLVISIQELHTKSNIIIHTKFIFNVDNEKSRLLDNSFNYLYDINCVYRQVSFKNSSNLKDKIKNIIDDNLFGDDIKLLSDFIEAPTMFINNQLKREKNTKYSLYSFIYEPRFKTQKCEDTTFNFKANFNNKYDIEVIISKYNSKYLIKYKLEDEVIEDEIDSLNNIHIFITNKIIELLDSK